MKFGRFDFDPTTKLYRMWKKTDRQDSWSKNYTFILATGYSSDKTYSYFKDHSYLMLKQRQSYNKYKKMQNSRNILIYYKSIA